MKKLLFSAACAALLASAGSAYADDPAADNNTGQLTIKATVSEGCSINFNGLGDVIDFGKLTKSSSNNNIKNSSFIVTCNGSPARVDLDNGKNAKGGERYMAATGTDGATHMLHYSIYQGSNGKIVWKDGKDTYKVAPANTKPGAEVDNPFYVLVTPDDVRAPDVASGNYQDTLVATVYYDNTGN